MGTNDKINILLVDDQPGKLLSYQVILQDLGENLLTASSAQEALQHLLKTDVGVLLVDVCMPDLDGFELARMVREHPRFQKTAIIFISAIMLTDLDRLRGYECGAVDYVPVPVVPEILRAKVGIFTELYRKTRQLEQLNSELEQRVAARTTELQDAVGALEKLNAELETRVAERTAQLVQAQKVEAIGKLTGGIAHDFNNLLSVVLNNLEVLRKRAGEDKALRLIDGAIEGAKRGTSLTQRLLAFARRQELKPEPVDAAALIGGMEDLLRRTLGPAVRIKTEFASDLWPAQVDANQLELALVNLAVNARDAMPQGGALTITARSDTVSKADQQIGLRPGNYVRIEVTDTGIGMDEATIERATDPFFTTKGVGRGTGLGLSIIHGLAEQSGGALRLASQPNVGTTVTLWLPRADQAPKTVNGAGLAEAPTSGAPCRVLLVEDDALVAMGMEAVLQELGHEVVFASSVDKALAILSAGASVDLVLTDFAMPGRNGADLAAEIRKSWPDIPVLLATGYADLPDGLDLGLPRVSKPCSEANLGAVIARLIDGTRTRRIAAGSR